MKGLIALVLLSIAVLLGLRRQTIFTCTTFFDFKKQDRWTPFCRVMDSILEYHNQKTLSRINKWVIVNEYSAESKEDWVAKCKEKYPFLYVIQKGPSQKGQAASMNIILDMIKPYMYWINWEDSWYARRSCLDRMFTIMDSTAITQLQCTQFKDAPNWLDSKTHPRKLMNVNGVDYYCIYPSPMPFRHYGDFDNWPLFSLLPSINRVADYKLLPPFSEDPIMWPIKFEAAFGINWLNSGCTKAVLPDGPVIRDNKAHKSTYSEVRIHI